MKQTKKEVELLVHHLENMLDLLCGKEVDETWGIMLNLIGMIIADSENAQKIRNLLSEELVNRGILPVEAAHTNLIILMPSPLDIFERQVKFVYN